MSATARFLWLQRGHGTVCQHRPVPPPLWQHSGAKPRLIFSYLFRRSFGWWKSITVLLAGGELNLNTCFFFNLLICVRYPATFCDWRHLNLDICSSGSSSSSSSRSHRVNICVWLTGVAAVGGRTLVDCWTRRQCWLIHDCWITTPARVHQPTPNWPVNTTNKPRRAQTPLRRNKIGESFYWSHYT